MKPDYNTNNYTQWYFFRIKNTRKNRLYKFNIKNLVKPDSLYNHGMHPLLYSRKDADAKNIGWYRDGEDVCYYQNQTKRKGG